MGKTKARAMMAEKINSFNIDQHFPDFNLDETGQEFKEYFRDFLQELEKYEEGSEGWWFTMNGLMCAIKEGLGEGDND